MHQNKEIVLLKIIRAKQENRLKRNLYKQKDWNYRVIRWRTKHIDHPNYRANGPAERRYRRMKIRVRELIKRLTDDLHRTNRMLVTIQKQQFDQLRMSRTIA